ncbi:protein YcgN [Lelliottia amnigena]|nr:protein YcgN [Lelliottia amnigena]
MSEIPFWQSKTLDEMTDVEWESLCDGCGQCCLHKLMDEDSDEIYFTNVACKQLNIKTCQCRNYERRFEYEPDCIKLTRDNLPTFEWLPHTCAYRLLAEGRNCRPGIRCSPVQKWRCMANVYLFDILR